MIAAFLFSYFSLPHDFLSLQSIEQCKKPFIHKYRNVIFFVLVIEVITGIFPKNLPRSKIKQDSL